MNVNNVYGHIKNNTDVFIAFGNHNEIHGLLTYNAHDGLVLKSLDSLNINEIVAVKLRYKSSNNKRYFSLKTKNLGMYINVNEYYEAIVNDQKIYFSIEYSVIDNFDREYLLSGSLYTIKYNNKPVLWKVENFSDADLIMFIPCTWYEQVDEILCEPIQSREKLLEQLKNNNFKGYSTRTWCEKASHVTNCTRGEYCGKCMGKCKNTNHICYPHKDHFKCGPEDVNMIAEENISYFEDTPVPKYNAVISVFIVFIVVIVGSTFYLKNEE